MKGSDTRTALVGRKSAISNLQSTIIVVGSSLGGLHALQMVLSALPADFSLPVLIVQHREHDADETLATLLQGYTPLRVIEVEDKTPIQSGHVYLAPPDYHLLIDFRWQMADGRFGDGNSPILDPQSAIRNREAAPAMLQSASYNLQSAISYHLALSTTEAPVHYARPSIDVLFESAADVYGRQAMGVILTGANDDGAAGLAAIKRRGGYAIVQDPATAEAPAMPNAAIEATEVDQILPLEEIGPFLVKRLGG